jgi:hypothetical protein
MSDSVYDLRDRLRPRFAGHGREPHLKPVSTAKSVESSAPAFAVENPEGNRVVIAQPIETAGFLADDFLIKFRGRLVEAEQANRNGAFWSQGDLEFGLPSVAHGPLNWGHDAASIVGTLVDPVLVKSEQAAAKGVGTHIQTGAVMWGFLYPERAHVLQTYIEAQTAWLSMECISQEVACVGPNGCGKVMPYADAQLRRGEACVHIKERASHRRFVNPIFQGAAVIVPPQQPGWANASILGTAEKHVEAANLQVPGLSDSDAVGMVASILEWSRRP